MKNFRISIFFLLFLNGILFSQKKVELKDLNHISKDYHHQSIWSYHKYNDLFYQNRKSDFDINANQPVSKIEEYTIHPKGDTIDFSIRFFNNSGDLDSIIYPRNSIKFNYNNHQILEEIISYGKYGALTTVRLDDSTFFTKGKGLMTDGYWSRDSYVKYSNGFERHYLQNKDSKHLTSEIEYRNNRIYRYSDKKLNRGDNLKLYNEKGLKLGAITLRNLKPDTLTQTKWFYNSSGFIEREILKGSHKSQNWDIRLEYSILNLENGGIALRIQKIKDGDERGIIVYYLDNYLNWIRKEELQVTGVLTLKRVRNITYHN